VEAVTATTAQVFYLVLAAGKAAGLLEGLELIRPDLANKINQIRTELARATWAAMGRPAPINEGMMQ